MFRPALPFLLIVVACSSNPEPRAPTPQAAQPAAFDPVGSYDFSVEIQGQVQSGELSITRQEGRLAGALSAAGQSVTLQNLVLDGHKLTATATGPQGGPEIGFTFNFEADGKYAGTLVIPGMGEARVYGARKKT